jgi:molecular chaperone GrpE (heat shock protein)
MNEQELNQLTTQLDEQNKSYVLVVKDGEGKGCYTKANLNCESVIVYHILESFIKAMHATLDNFLEGIKQNNTEEDYHESVRIHRTNMKTVWRDAFKPFLQSHVIGIENVGTIDTVTKDIFDQLKASHRESH